MSDEDPVAAVLAANEAFYKAFATGDVNAMAELWADDGITCIHPGWDVLVGRTQVIASWMGILTNPSTGTIRCTNPVGRIDGTGAFVICGEELGDAKMIATNTFMFDGTRWRMTHHHGGQVVQRVQFTPPTSAMN